MCRRRRVGAALVAAAMAGGMLTGGAPSATADGGPEMWRSWLLSSPDQFRLAAPPGEDSARTRRDIHELLALQSRRTAAESRRARYWDRIPATFPWTRLALKMVKRHRPRPAPAARGLALLHNAMYDALIAAHDSRAAYARPAPHKLDDRIEALFPGDRTTYPPVQAVVAGAAEEILIYLFPNESTETFQSKARRAVRSRLWAGVNYPSDVSRGRDLGNQVAELFIEYGENDGHLNTGFAYPRPEGEEYWERTPVGFEEPIGGPVGTWKPWLMESVEQTIVDSAIPGPFAYGSSRFMAETQEVIDVQAGLTQEQAEIAVFWDDGPGTLTPPGHWNDIALDLVKSADMGTSRTARIFSLLNAVEYDGAVAFFNAKYQWWSIRPVTVVRRLCENGSRLCTKAELEADPSLATYPDWLPYISTPPFPAYPGGHSTFSGGAAALLEDFFPEASGLLNELAEEAAMSRLYGGIHFRSDNDDGLKLGRAIAQEAIQWDPANN